MMSRWPLALVLMLATSPSMAADYSGKALAATAMRRDVALDERSVLKGRTSPNSEVILRRAGFERRIVSGPDGGFSTQIQPGVYLVHVGDLVLVCRAWTNNTSPRCATEELVLPATVVRGQNGSPALMSLDQLAWPAIIVTGVGFVGWAAIDGGSAS